LTRFPCTLQVPAAAAAGLGRGAARFTACTRALFGFVARIWWRAALTFTVGFTRGWTEAVAGVSALLSFPDVETVDSELELGACVWVACAVC
jgi:hypothetical protein